MERRLLLGVLVSSLLACTEPPPAEGNIGAPDADIATDAGVPDPDSGVPDRDPDSGVLDVDSGVPDAGVPDAGVPDSGVPDAGVPDSGVPDSGVPDAGVPDAGVPDAGVPDAGVPDAGVPDAGVPDAGTCFDFGCSSGQCCSAKCVDTQDSSEHCGGCNRPCATAPNLQAQCRGGVCERACQVGFFDCDAAAANGCESSTPCLCVPGATMACYSGPPGTLQIGVCRGGSQACESSGLAWGPCGGEVTPTQEVCADRLDQDCDGIADDSLDEDGDGYSLCDRDCCDAPGQCASPIDVGPGAFEVDGNGVDDNCDGTVDETALSCDHLIASDTSRPLDSARALGVCRAAAPQGAWGLIEVRYFLADTAGTPAAAAHSVRTQFGPNNTPREGSRLLVLSTGPASALGQPGADPNQSTNFGLSSSLPADWLAANAGQLPVPQGCPPLQNSWTAYDPVMLYLKLKAPQNAHSLAVDAKYFTADYAKYVCSPYVDQFVALLQSAYQPQGSQPTNPVDGNIAAVALPTGRITLSANLAFGDTGAFTSCVNGPTGCVAVATSGSHNACTGTAQLLGTGYDTPAPGQCDSAALRGGATGWRTLRGNVVPGETLVLRFLLWDMGDGRLDSTVLLDNFRWSTSNVVTP